MQADSTAAPPTGVADPQRAVLIRLFEDCNGPQWKKKNNWATEEPLHSWRGVAVNCDGDVTELSLIKNNLSGLLPNLSVLHKLERLALAGNGLVGSLEWLTQCSELQTVRLGKNCIRGCIPDGLAVSCPKLKPRPEKQARRPLAKRPARAARLGPTVHWEPGAGVRQLVAAHAPVPDVSDAA